MRPLIAALALLLLVLGQSVAEAQTLPNGGKVGGNIASVGQTDTYTFTANAGDGIWLSMARTGAGTLLQKFKVITPLGETLLASTGPNFTTSWGFINASSAGTYTVQAYDASNTHTGTYDLYFARASGANELGHLFDGIGREEQIDVGDLDTYTFEATAGQRFTVIVTDLDHGVFVPEFLELTRFRGHAVKRVL